MEHWVEATKIVVEDQTTTHINERIGISEEAMGEVGKLLWMILADIAEAEDYNPIAIGRSGVALGILIERQRRNMATKDYWEDNKEETGD